MKTLSCAVLLTATLALFLFVDVARATVDRDDQSAKQKKEDNREARDRDDDDDDDKKRGDKDDDDDDKKRDNKDDDDDKKGDDRKRNDKDDDKKGDDKKKDDDKKRDEKSKEQRAREEKAKAEQRAKEQREREEQRAREALKAKEDAERKLNEALKSKADAERKLNEALKAKAEAERKAREAAQEAKEEAEQKAREQQKAREEAARQKAIAEQRAREQKAAASVAEADADFVWQGEYEGCVYTPGAGSRQLGLQVVALGDGKFDGVVYSGGLPGAGWDRSRKTRLHGSRSGALLTMSGDLLRAAVQPTHADLRDTSGNHIGTLKKVFRRSRSLGAKPSQGAIVLFDGTSTEQFDGAKTTDDGLLMAGPVTKQSFGDFFLHLEFRTPYMPYARGQGRGNSGVYVQRRYEVQILDSFGLAGEANECGGLYRQKAPDVNMALPPLSWQTYDIHFTAARFDVAGNKTAPARITVWHNGVAVHSNYAIVGKTGAGQAEAANPLPILLQHHGNPVVFRNIWLVPGGVAACAW